MRMGFDWMMEIRLYKDYDLKGYTFIEGFPGAGLVGPMAVSYMVEKLEIEPAGYIESDLFPPIAAVHNGIPMHVARLYVDTKDRLLMALSEFMIPVNAVYQLGNELLSFARKNGISRIVSIGGMPAQKPGDTAYIITSDKDELKRAAGMKPIEEGVIAGVSAVLITGAKIFNIPADTLLVPVDPLVMDPKYAEVAIQGLQKLIGLRIDLTDLEKEAKEVEARVREMMKKTKDSHDHYRKTAEEEEPGPSMYA